MLRVLGKVCKSEGCERSEDKREGILSEMLKRERGKTIRMFASPKII